MPRSIPRLLGASVALLGLTALLLPACGGPPPKDPSQMTGAELFLANCARCHGRAGEGSFLAPNIKGASEHWTVDQLVIYIRDPQKVIAEDERLRAQGQQYSQRMPAFPQLSPDQRAKVAEWVLRPR